MRYIAFLGLLILFIVGVNKSKFDDDLKLNAEASPKIQAEPVTNDDSFDEYTFKCKREWTSERKLIAPVNTDDRKQSKE